MNQVTWFMVWGQEKKSKKFAKEKGLSCWDDVLVWMDFRPPYILEALWWCLNISCGGHNIVGRTKPKRFMVSLPHITVDSFYLFCMQSKFYDFFS